MTCQTSKHCEYLIQDIWHIVSIFLDKSDRIKLVKVTNLVWDPLNQYFGFPTWSETGLWRTDRLIKKILGSN